MTKVNYHDMLPYEIVRRRKIFPAAFVPFGLLEWHGEHLSVGNDGLLAEEICKRAASKSGGFTFPTIWYSGFHTYGYMEANKDPDGKIRAKMGFEEKKFTREYLGLKDGEERNYTEQIVRHLLLQMDQMQMKAVLLVFGHCPWRQFTQKAIDDFKRKFKHVKVEGAGVNLFSRRTKFTGGDHAGQWETSCLMHLRPDCVDMNVYKGKTGNDVMVGIIGEDPRIDSSPEFGRRASEIMVEALVKKAEKMLGKKRVLS